jgi:hypothetical protein
VTERDWLAPSRPDAPYRMLTHMREQGIARRKGGRRKLRLLACACCRLVWPLLGEEHRRTVEVAERVADGRADREEQAAASATARQAALARADYNGWAAAQAAAATARPNAAEAARLALLRTFDAWARHPRSPGAVDKRLWAECERCQCGLFRDLFRNPFRPPAVLMRPAVLAHHGGAARRLAEAIYEGRRFEDLPVLADVLEEAGCCDAALLGHLRGPGPHVLGCWALDGVLGKS